MLFIAEMSCLKRVQMRGSNERLNCEMSRAELNCIFLCFYLFLFYLFILKFVLIRLIK